MRASHCKHGNRRALGVCPACTHARDQIRQRRADRIAFKVRIAKILGKGRAT